MFYAAYYYNFRYDNIDRPAVSFLFSSSTYFSVTSLLTLQPPIFQVPWPFLSDEILVSLLKKNKKKKKKYIHLILKKSLSDPFPCEFGGRSKWDLNLLKP
jgi:hypothetical protein